MKRTTLLLAAALALALAACGEQASQTPTTAPTPSAEPTPEATPTPTETEVAETAEPTGDDGAGSAGALADSLPDQIAGLQRTEIPGMEAMIEPMLAQQGFDAEEADFAFATYGDGELIVTGFRMPGLQAAQLEQIARMMSAGQVGETDVEGEPVMVGGKEVLRMSGTDVPEAAYLYFSDEAFFTIISESADLAEELLSQLP